MLRARDIVRHSCDPVADEVVLNYEDRHRRRIVLRGARGLEFLLDLADVPDLREGDTIRLDDGSSVRVRAADEPLMEVRCADAGQFSRIAWHIGNRHLAAEISGTMLRLRADHVIADMVRGLGGEVRALSAPFNPGGGAYGRGGVHGHEPVRPVAHAHDHSHGHNHDDGHSHGHGHAHPHPHE